MTVTVTAPLGFSQHKGSPWELGCFPPLLVHSHEDPSSFQGSHFLRKLAGGDSWTKHRLDYMWGMCSLWELHKAFSSGFKFVANEKR